MTARIPYPDRVGGVNAFRIAQRADFPGISRLIFDTVRNGPSLYSEAERAAWMPQLRAGADWEARLDRQTILLAENESGLRGLMSIDPAGYIDFAYIHPSAQGSGLFRMLYQRVETQALASGATVLSVHASRMARPAFTAVGFEVVAREVVAIADQSLERFAMRKQLPAQVTLGLNTQPR